MHKILIVDDERPARDYIAELLSEYIPNLSVTKEENPLEALIRMQNEDFDLLFVDINFGVDKMSGLDFLEEIGKLGKNPYTVIISAHYNFDYAIKSMELGAFRYIPKPPDKDFSEETEAGMVKCITKPLYKEKIYESVRLYLSRSKAECIEFRTVRAIHRVTTNHIIAIQTSGNGKVDLYTLNGLISGVICSISQLQMNLPSHFFLIWRDCVVNLYEVKRFDLTKRCIYIVCQNKEYQFAVSRYRMRELLNNVVFKSIVKS